MDYMIGIHITVIISVLLLIRLAFPRKFGNVPLNTIFCYFILNSGGNENIWLSLQIDIGHIADDVIDYNDGAFWNKFCCNLNYDPR